MTLQEGSGIFGAALPLWAALPFLLLLIAIAVLPLLRKHWWEKFYPAVSIGLGLITAAYYLLFRGELTSILQSEIQFISFIALVGSLYVIAGGIHIRLKGRSRPLTNVAFLAFGAVMANLIGTTGASMILIRPFIRVNRYRVRPFHVVFFIFIVSNMGGALTPIGDPPLFLGYLRGVPFLWVLGTSWHIWLLAMTVILAVFYLFDRRAYGKLPAGERHRTEDVGEEAEASGLPNLFFLAIVLCAVFVTDPPFVREGLMLAAGLGSWFTTRKEIHKKNEFDFFPIKEVAILFLGIFTTMVPALQWIEQNSGGLGLRAAGGFYWATGALSSVLDNAPTYLNFFSAAVGVFVSPAALQEMMRAVREGVMSTDQATTAALMQSHPVVIQAISLAAVFFGAMTYIGNGPNLMVKSIAEQSGVRCPSFGAYIARYAIPVLLPIFTLVWLIFFRN